MNDPEIKEALQDLLVQRVVSEPLSPAETEQIGQATALDPNFAVEAASLERAFHSLAFTAQAAPPPRLRARLLESVRRAAAHPQPTQTTNRWLQSWRYAAAASVTLAFVVGGGLLALDDLRLRRTVEMQSQAIAMLSEPNIVMSFALQGTGRGDRASGIVLFDLDRKRASIAVSDLPALPPGQTYFLWAKLENKQVPCGAFQLTASGRLLHQFTIPVDSYTSPVEQLVLTIEKRRDAVVQDGPVVMASKTI
jgi:hypothetical protein